MQRFGWLWMLCEWGSSQPASQAFLAPCWPCKAPRVERAVWVGGCAFLPGERQCYTSLSISIRPGLSAKKCRVGFPTISHLEGKSVSARGASRIARSPARPPNTETELAACLALLCLGAMAESCNPLSLAECSWQWHRRSGMAPLRYKFIILDSRFLATRGTLAMAM